MAFSVRTIIKSCAPFVDNLHSWIMLPHQWMKGVSTGIISSSLFDRPSQACGRKAERNGQDLGDVHNWPHSHYLVRQCNEVDGEKCG